MGMCCDIIDDRTQEVIVKEAMFSYSSPQAGQNIIVKDKNMVGFYSISDVTHNIKIDARGGNTVKTVIWAHSIRAKQELSK